jgi:secondary thiamine-phosphate synthase enzyme
MAVETKRISVSSRGELDIIDITGRVSGAVRDSGIKDGIVSVFVPGSTASVSTIEFEPNLVKDFGKAMERLVPSDIGYEHSKAWNDDNGKSHVRATLMGPGITVPFQDRKLILGNWQQIALLDFDVPAREREIVLQIIGD